MKSREDIGEFLLWLVILLSLGTYVLWASSDCSKRCYPKDSSVSTSLGCICHSPGQPYTAPPEKN